MLCTFRKVFGKVLNMTQLTESRNFSTHTPWAKSTLAFCTDSYSMLVIIKIFFLAVPAGVLPTFCRVSFKKLSLVAIGTLLQVGIDKCCAEIAIPKEILVDWWNFQYCIGTVHASIVTFWAVASISNHLFGQILICCSIETASTKADLSFFISKHSRIFLLFLTKCAIFN